MNDVLVVVVGTSDVSLIPGISIAGPSPEATHFTPALDVEYLLAGRPITLDVVPATPEGIPTPALVTRALTSDVPKLVVDAGARVQPQVPRVVLGGVPGDDIRRGALPREAAERIVKNGVLLGRQLAGLGRVVLGESIPGGTTTAMAILAALGYDAWGRTSSAAPNNPKELKTAVVKEAVSRLKPPVDAVTAASEVGDPVHLALAAIALGVVAAGGEVLLAGGTQMAAAAALFKALGGDPGRLAVVTTRWIVEDSSADFLGLMREVGVGRVYHSKSSFADSRCRGLRAYEEGYVKEGVAMGYALWRAEAAGVDVLRRVEEEYVRVVGPCG
ncbi:MAG: TIGR00303 family protein [Pyrobaculum sp.]|nr:TIGR00303 family protein [Pyrobaculum sp.]